MTVVNTNYKTALSWYCSSSKAMGTSDSKQINSTPPISTRGQERPQTRHSVAKTSLGMEDPSPTINLHRDIEGNIEAYKQMHR